MSRHFALQPSGTHMTKAHASGRRSHNRLVASAASLICAALAGVGIVATLGGCAPSQHAAIYDDDARICDNADSYTFVNGVLGAAEKLLRTDVRETSDTENKAVSTESEA